MNQHPASPLLDFRQKSTPNDIYEINKIKESYKRGTLPIRESVEAIVKPDCQEFFQTQEYKSGNRNLNGYAICCDTFKFCKEDIASSEAPNDQFYKQTWFFCVCGGVGLLLIAIISVTVFFICRKKKRGSGGGSGLKEKSTGGKKGRKAGGQDEDGSESNGSFKSDHD